VFFHRETIMQEITLQALLEAGCHFGHKAERWHPKASAFIYTKKDGIHIIDLVKTKEGIEKALTFVSEQVKNGGEVLFVGTKRQARGILKQEAESAGAPYFSERWIGGFLTNWEQIKTNIEKIIRMTDERESGAWKKFPKHEQSKMSRYLERIRIYYGGVLKIKKLPAAVFVVDVKKEVVAVREARRMNIPIIGIVDTNSDPTYADYVIPANDDAVGSVTYVVHQVATAYKEAKDAYAKNEEQAAEAKAAELKKQEEIKAAEKPVEAKTEAKMEAVKPVEVKAKEEKPKKETKKKTK